MLGMFRMLVLVWSGYVCLAQVRLVV